MFVTHRLLQWPIQGLRCSLSPLFVQSRLAGAVMCLCSLCSLCAGRVARHPRLEKKRGPIKKYARL
jgi:hypothetical protein